MRYNFLGRTGLFVSELSFGAMTFGSGTEGLGASLGNLQLAEATGLLKTAFDAGVNLIDTANVYGAGRSEEITGQAIKNLGIARGDYILATKFFGQTGNSRNSSGASRYHILEAVEDSLRRLQVSHIDLYQVHGFDVATPIEETVEALDTLVRRGQVRYIGISNWAAWQIVKALGISERRGLARFQSLQAYYNLAARDLEREIVPMMTSENVGLLVWSPLAGGLLTGKYTRDAKDGGWKGGSGRLNTFDLVKVNKDRAQAVIDALRPMAEARGATLAQIAIAWLLHQPVVTSVIMGASRPDQLADNLGATKVTLSDDELKILDGVSQLPIEYPGFMLDRHRRMRSNLPLQQPAWGPPPATK